MARRGGVVGLAVALVAAGCSHGPSGRPVAGPGRVRTVVGHELFGGEPFPPYYHVAVGPDGTLYAIGQRGDIGEAGGRNEFNSLVAIPRRGPIRLLAGRKAIDKPYGSLPPDAYLDPFPRLKQPGLGLSGLAVGGDGTVFVGDRNNSAVWAMAPDGRTRTVAGTGEEGFSGDGGPAVAAQLGSPTSLAWSPKTGDLFIATYDGRIRKVDPAGVITSVAGVGERLGEGGIGGGPAIRAGIGPPYGMAVDPRSGELYFCNSAVLRRIDAAGTLILVAGTGELERQPSPNGRRATEVPVSCEGVAVDPRDNVVYFADGAGNQIRRLGRSGLLEAVAGNGKEGGAKDGPALKSPLSPINLAVDRKGDLYFVPAAEEEQIIRMVGAGPPRR